MSTTDAIPSVDWWVTSRCTLACDFCYGPRPSTDPVHLREAIGEAIAASPATVVTFCGGEPLVVPKIFELAARQRAAGKSVVLNTNGELLVRRFETRRDLPFDIVGISIDGPDAATHRQMRGARADFAATFAAACWLSERGLGTKLKLATVVSSVNRDRIEDLARLVGRLRPDLWRLYQYSPWGEQNHGRARHRIDDADFAAIVERAVAIAAPVTVHASSTASTTGCFIVDPAARVLQPAEQGYLLVGNCLEESIETIWTRSTQQSVIATNKRWLQLI